MVTYIQMELPIWHDLGCGNQYRYINKEPWIEYRGGNSKTRKEKREKIRNRNRERKKIDVNFKIRTAIRSRMTRALKIKSIKKQDSSLFLLGCTIQEAKKHIEKQFKEGMSWDNHSMRGWHIDHIIPCASFDLTDPEQQKKCFHYTNLQPLWAKENMSKGAKIL